VLSFFYTVLEGRWSPTDQAQAIENIDMQQLKMFSKDFVSVFNARVLVAGNHDQNSLVSIIKQLEVLNFADTAISMKVAKLGSYDVSREIKVDHNDAVLVEYIQGDNDSIRERATVGLLSQIISAPFYNEMRTQKQLGYVVSAFAMPINRVPGICLIAQSPVATEQVLKSEFSDFNQNFSQQVAAIDAEALDRHKNALLVNIEKTPDNLYELNARHLQSLELGYENFDFRKKLAEAIRATSVSEIKAAYQRLIIDKPRRLWVQTKNRDSLNSGTNNNVPIDQHYVFPY
jgi:secreted Zn-dependent insulinase-like peptidase